MRQTALVFAPLLVCLVISSFSARASAAGCQGKVLLEAKFTTPDPHWWVGKADIIDKSFHEGNYRIKFVGDGNDTQLYAAESYEDVEICANLRLSESVAPGRETAGLVFWAKDVHSPYWFSISAIGEIAGAQKSGYGTPSYPLPIQVHTAVQKGVGRTNALRVVLKGDEATFYVNDQRVGVITGRLGNGKSYVGLHAEGTASTTANTIWEFSKFVVTKP